MDLFETVPNFSEGRHREVIDAIASAASPDLFVLDVDPDPDHNRTVLSLAGDREGIAQGILRSVQAAVERIDLGRHEGVHPRVGAADVVPIIPLGDASLESARELARAVGELIWTRLRVPVFFYGHGERKTLADIRAGRAGPDLGGPALHPTAGAVSVGARRALVAFNVILFDYDMVAARALARSIRESGEGLRGVQALAFDLPGARVQLSMNLFRIDETTPSDIIAELGRRGVPHGPQQIVGLCPAVAASAAADGRLLEARLAAAAARAAAAWCEKFGSDEMLALAARLRRESGELAQLTADQDAILGGAERAAALVHVQRAAKLVDPKLESLLTVAARGFRRAVTPATESIYRARIDALDARLV